MNAVIGFGGAPPPGYYNWGTLFGHQSEWGNWKAESGTIFPLPSIPVARAWRYYWAVQSWRVQYDITQAIAVPGRTPIVFHSSADTGWLPYGVGKSAWSGGPVVLDGRNWGESGNGLLAPTQAGRQLGMITNGGSDLGNRFGTSIHDYIELHFLGFNRFSYAGNAQKGLVYDDSVPGNVFPVFTLYYFHPTVTEGHISSVKHPNPAAMPVKTSLVAAFDGVPFDIWVNSINVADYPFTDPLYLTVTGNISITTRDS